MRMETAEIAPRVARMTYESMRVLVATRALAAACAFVCTIELARAGSEASLRFHGTGSGQDRARIPVDDDQQGANASQPADVGGGGFTLELWVRGTLAQNPSAPLAAGSYADARWLAGEVLLDRSVAGPSAREFGVSLAGGRVCFFTGAGDAPSTDAPDTTVGALSVLDDAWHHVALVRDAQSGVKSIYVDGVLDRASPANVSRADLSYPDRGLGQIGALDSWLSIAAHKYDLAPAFSGWIDELRVWETARGATELAVMRRRRILPDTPFLAADFRLDDGYGTVIVDASDRHNAAGVLVAGIAGNGEWIDASQSPGEVAPMNGSLPFGFRREVVATGLSNPVAIEFLPDGRALIAQTGGTIHVLQNGALLPQPLVTLPVAMSVEQGLMGLCADPQFASNGWIYALSVSTEPRVRLSRLTVVGSSASLASEVVLWQAPVLAGQTHQAGGLTFGLGGRLFLGLGDGTQPALAQDNTSVLGKILRLNKDGSVPSDNPFVGVPSARPEIWASGLRNPFRIHLDPLSGRIWVSDVGASGVSAYEELNRLERGANYGWPLQEGPICHQSNCSALRVSELHFRHDQIPYTTGFPQACIVVGPTWNSPSFPSEFQGNVFFGDYSNGWIRRATTDAAGNVVSDHPFELMPDSGPVVDMAQGPDGALYVVTINPGMVSRIRYATSSNAAPLVDARVSPRSGLPPLTVRFVGSASSDPDQGPSALTFTWNFGDGASSTQADVAHVYTQPGRYLASLVVSDGADVVRSDDFVVQVGNTPVTTISTPSSGAVYRAGDVISFSGGASDVEDGALPPSALTWTVLLEHEHHEHPVLGPLHALGGSFTVPASGHGPEHTHYRIRLAAVDSDGLITTSEVEIQPLSVDLSLRTRPVVVPLTLDGEPLVPPDDYESLSGFQHQLAAPPSFVVAGQTWLFDFWSNGARTPSLVLSMTDAPVTLKAFYRLDTSVETTSTIVARSRNAEWRASTGQSSASPYDTHAICVGADGGQIQAGLEFSLPIPRGARIVSARLEMRGATDQQGTPQIGLRAYSVGNAPPFVASSPVALSAHAPLGAQLVVWNAPSFHEDDDIVSPDLTSLLQPVIDRADWSANQSFGLVLLGDAAPNGTWRCVHNLGSGDPPVLRVRWSALPPDPTLPPSRH